MVLCPFYRTAYVLSYGIVKLSVIMALLGGEPLWDITHKMRLSQSEYYGAAEPPVRCGESHLSGLTEPPHFIY